MNTDLLKLKGRWEALTRPVTAIQIPDGTETTLEANTEFELVHELGGDYTIKTRYGLMYRVDGVDGDAIGKQRRERPVTGEPRGEVTEEAVKEQLAQCFDPEIPVNIVDLGLVYETRLEQNGAGTNVFIKMTLTAPGCGMGQVLVNDVERKVKTLPGVGRVEVELVFSPPWQPCMMSDAARLAVGLM